MSGRQTVVHLLVGVLLGCPFLCLSDLGRGETPEAHALSCACCPSESSDRQPSDDGSNREQKDCLCRGAVVSAPPCVAEGEVEATPLWAFDYSVEATNRLIAVTAAQRGLSSHFPPLSSGRDVRTIIASFLL